MPRGEAKLYAVIRDKEEREARVRIWRVEVVWMVVRVREAREAEGRRARDGRVMVERLYDTPCEVN